MSDPREVVSDAVHVGDALMVTDASGVEHAATATTGVLRGYKFPVVYVDFGDGDPRAWPAESLRRAAATPENER